ncbi:MAG: hypothetical protein NT013_10420 [Planctomycetia bacterium]|nr:hypothetical protein [Planctomycetia bacterium]
MNNPREDALEQAGKAMKVLGIAYLILVGYLVVLAIWTTGGILPIWAILSVVPISLTALTFTLRRFVRRGQMWAVICAMIQNVLVSTQLLIAFSEMLTSVVWCPTWLIVLPLSVRCCYLLFLARRELLVAPHG